MATLRLNILLLKIYPLASWNHILPPTFPFYYAPSPFFRLCQRIHQESERTTFAGCSHCLIDKFVAPFTEQYVDVGLQPKTFWLQNFMADAQLRVLE
jgi:hypothetical protein